jgi:glycosyltransferase involved in cell wall biosynthesis
MRGLPAVLEGATILVFADDWGIHPSSAQHLFRRFLRGNRVVWFDTVGLRLPRPNLRDVRKILRKIRHWTTRRPIENQKPETGNLKRRLLSDFRFQVCGLPEIHDIPLVPLQFGSMARVINARILRRAVRGCLGATPVDQSPYIVSTLPLTADLTRYFPEATFIYYLVDDYASWPGMNSELVQRMDREQAGSADLIVAASRELASLHEEQAKRVAYLPHGVDLDHFAQAREIRARRKSQGERPLADVIFFGALDERIDRELFATVIKARPKIRFLCVGPTPDSRARLPDAKNLECRDPVPYEELPALLGQCEATILPYVRGDLGKRLAPLKAMEALAAGLPVIATDVPELRSLSVGVYLGESVGNIAPLLDDALSAKRRLPSLQDLVENSWEKRAECFSDLLLATRTAQVSS